MVSWSSPQKTGLILVAFAVALISSSYWLQVPDLKPGMPAPSDEIAPRDGLVKYKEANQKNKSDLMQRTIFVQVIDKEQSELLTQRLERKLRELDLLANTDKADRIPPVNLTVKEQNWLKYRSKNAKKEWENNIFLVSKRMLSQGLVNTLGIDQLIEASSLQLADLGDMESPRRTLASKLLASTFQGSTNLRKDSTLQVLLEDTITRQSRTIQVREGDIITRKGEMISPQDYYVLEHFNLIKKNIRFFPFFGTFAEAIASCGVLILIMRRERPCLTPRQGLLALFLLLLAQTGKVFFGSYLSPLAILIPPTLLLSQGLGSTSALSWLAVGTLLWQLPIATVNDGRMTVACIIAAIVAIQGSRMRSRAQLLQMTFLLPFGGLIGEWVFLRGNEIPNSSDDLILEAIVMGSVLITSVLIIPILETTFGLITKARLMELADQERPLLRRLSLEAPGTFEHTLTICSLAEEAARTIGADFDLIKTGGLYHDIGKLHAPKWFIENQTYGSNPHEELNDPYASADILQAHVDEGLKLAKRHRLPSPIADFIPEHQGRLKMGYFLHLARKESPSISEDRFRYKGPIPRSRETAILMLADGCEAALRSLDPMTTDKEAWETVRSIVKSRQKDGQLKESSLKRSEIELIVRAFVRVWRRMRHKRIPYPIAMKKST